MNVLKTVEIPVVNFDDYDIIYLKIKEWRKSKSKVGVRFIPVWREVIYGN